MNIRAEIKMSLPLDHPALPASRVGLLIVNLGTPDAPTPGAVRRYLAEFLSDRRVVDYPRLLWLPLLHGVILNIRPARSAHAYQKIWTEGGSPLRVYAERTARALAERLGPKAVVDFAMRYGEPSIGARIKALQEKGCDRIVLLPLYPQHSRSTTASVGDAAFDALKELVWQPAIRMAAAYHDLPAYIDALASSARDGLAALGWMPERIILSFHGTPKRHLTEGDPYHCHCMKTARLLREQMGWTQDFAPVAFQSRFGREEWLSPATDDMIAASARDGVKRLAVMTPGFLADCLETLEEIAIGGHETFVASGGAEFAALPCLNDSVYMTDLLEALVAREAAGWLEG
ncbi:MAG: ferrochelatase [Parvularculaceae bacterium]|nr:ferrochelatase [Parvularculaceae bacterium]